jgi:lysozyme
MIDAVIDISHHNGNNLDFIAASQSVAGVIHKATQGLGWIDPMLAANRDSIYATGLMFGGYHFGDGSDAASQAQFFLDTLNPQPGDLLALDLEANPGGPSMTLDGARAFVAAIQAATGIWPLLYSGEGLKAALGGQADPVLANCPLWLAEWGPDPVLPPGWNAWGLWQYSNGAVGAPPPVPGIGYCDRDRFGGKTLADLQNFWATAAAS